MGRANRGERQTFEWPSKFDDERVPFRIAGPVCENGPDGAGGVGDGDGCGDGRHGGLLPYLLTCRPNPGVPFQSRV